MTDMSQDLAKHPWTLYDKITYGGLGYSAFCLPSNFFIIIVTILFPPLGQFINVVEDTITESLPFFTWATLTEFLKPSNLSSIIYSFILTALFYIPGLIYVLGNIADSELAPTPIAK